MEALKIDTYPLISYKKDYINHFKAKEPRTGVLFCDFIEEMIAKKARRRSASFPQQYRSVINHIKRFCEIYNCEIFTNSVTEDFLDDFICYLEDQKLKHNTIKGFIERIKNMARKAGQYSYAVDSTYDEVSLTEEESYSVFLSMNEITRIYYYEFKNQRKAKKKERIRDLFIVGCLTALRFSDYSTLTAENFQERYIVKRTQKTNVTVKIPIHDYIYEIYKKYDGNIPNGYTSQHFNRYLKIICREIGLNDKCTFSYRRGGKVCTETKEKWEMITSHTARRSAATNLYLTGRMKTFEIMKLTGHTCEKNFFKYIKLTSDDTAQQIAGDIFFRK